tara:strand:+ start:5614 stop:7431 length:1818 start_codon:yes stop_codon:yes gene_type:complete
MTFFNRKEEVIDIELTQYGKLLLAKGKFKPKKYAFFDDDVIYDAQYMTPTDPTSVSNPIAENQNDAGTRIKEAVRGRAQHNYGSAYNLGEIEEGEHNVLMSVGTQNLVGVIMPEKILSEAKKVYKYQETFAYVSTGNGKKVKQTIEQWVPSMLEIIGKKIKAASQTFYKEQTGATVVPHSTEFKVKATMGTWNNDTQKYNFGNPFITVTKYVSQFVKKFVSETTFETMEFGKGRTVFDHDIYYEGIPLGSAELQNQKLPAWEILALNQKELNLRSLTLDLMDAPPGNKLLDSFNTKFYTYGDLPIPQISADIKIKALVDDSKTINPLEEDIVEAQIVTDGFTMRVKNDYLLLMIDEKNTYFENENFDIEVFEMQNNSSPSTATFIVSGVGSISNGQTLKFTTNEGAVYSAAIDTSVAKADSVAHVIGTSDVTTNADLAESIVNSIQAKLGTASNTVTFKQIDATSNYQVTIEQAGFTEVYTKDYAVQGTLFTAGVLTGLVNWDENPASKILKRLYFSEDPNNKESPMLYTPRELQTPASIPVTEDRVSYYMNVFVDEEIDSQLFNRYQDKLKNLRGDKLLKSQGATRSNAINIYGEDIEDVGEIC